MPSLLPSPVYPQAKTSGLSEGMLWSAEVSRRVPLVLRENVT